MHVELDAVREQLWKVRIEKPLGSPPKQAKYLIEKP